MVWIPKYRRQALYAELRKYLGPVLRELARQRECVVEEGHLNLDHVHMLLSIPPKVRGGPGPLKCATIRLRKSRPRKIGQAGK